jgi:hypothetical protein
VTAAVPTQPLRLRVEVAALPDPHLLRAAIAARLAGRPWAGPEAPVAELVVEAVTASRVDDRSPTDNGSMGWR